MIVATFSGRLLTVGDTPKGLSVVIEHPRDLGRTELFGIPEHVYRELYGYVLTVGAKRLRVDFSIEVDL